jgi:hypothetical protein
MNNPVWEWLIRSRESAYAATQRFDGPSALTDGPGWCFDRFGQTSTILPDGRTVLIAGEHEDHYDPDFFIYNDVVICYPDDQIDIFGYPREVFPPTDFHTANLSGDRIVIIGSLGYPEERKLGTTPVMILDLNTFAISSVLTSGPPPGWLHNHRATLSEDGSSILIQKGKVHREVNRPLVENIDDWRLHFKDWRWERLTERRWARCEMKRQDGKPNHLFEIRQTLWSRDFEPPTKFERDMQELARTLGARPNLDSLTTLYRPNVPHELVPQEDDEFSVFRIKVDGIVVRYVEEMYSIQMTVEGDLQQRTFDALAADLLEKLTTLENTSCERLPL